jgi:hypothetical protein
VQSERVAPFFVISFLVSRVFVDFNFFHQNPCGIKKICTFASPEPAKPLNDAQMCGSFFFMPMPMPNRIPFHKTYTNSHDLVVLLRSRGLTVNDPAKAERYLDYIGYYRLSAYMYPLLRMPMGFPQGWQQEPLWQR